MPKRTNTFQTVVYLIQQHLAGSTAVEESAMLPDLLTGTKREVDVLVTGEVAGRTVRIALECRDFKRRQSVTWVEEMHGKHARLPTDVLVLVSSSGFTPEAERVAAKYGIQLVVPGVAEEAAARTIVGRAAALWFKQVSLTLTRVEVGFAAAEGEGDVGPDATEDRMYDRAGTPQGTLFEYAESTLKSIDFAELTINATGDETHFDVYSTPEYDGLDGEVAGPAFLLDTEATPPVLREIASVRLTGDAAVVVAQVPLSHGELSGTPYSYGSAKAGPLNVLLLVTEPDEKTRKVTAHVTSVKPPKP